LIDLLAIPALARAANALTGTQEGFAMMPSQTNRQATSAVVSASCKSMSVVGLVLVLLATSPQARSQQPIPAAAVQAPLTTEQVVQNLRRMNLVRAEALHSYEGERSYHVEYRGFPGNRSAAMNVKATFVSPNAKHFTVESASGSNLIIEKVFKKLLEAESEAMTADNQRRSALTEENYRFTLVAYQKGPLGEAYVLDAEPRTKDKFLYRGKVWVDAKDFAVTRLEVRPAKNPSFWTKSADIDQVYKKVGEFWLPESNRSVTTIRLGGRAELTILYKDYKIIGGSEVNGAAAPKPAFQSNSGQ
jgi:hypothetical protein